MKPRWRQEGQTHLERTEVDTYPPRLKTKVFVVLVVDAVKNIYDQIAYLLACISRHARCLVELDGALVNSASMRHEPMARDAMRLGIAICLLDKDFATIFCSGT
ncbi:hypothetical protein GOP47_0010730 [Adiantum capillus-veneris]|uniref:Uncharacterized protein n=1 Tax=Adiantum capillus-veneris TaxID=13818 RepID=A0A9D4ZGN9_ADICA|nr:hypothetical protein GOP47_0010730 [Adiantum capillus-veneris]